MNTFQILSVIVNTSGCKDFYKDSQNYSKLFYVLASRLLELQEGRERGSRGAQGVRAEPPNNRGGLRSTKSLRTEITENETDKKRR